MWGVVSQCCVVVRVGCCCKHYEGLGRGWLSDPVVSEVAVEVVVK